MAILKLHNIHLRVDEHDIIRGVSLELWEGYVHALVGPNGAGKSTLAAIIMGLDGYRHATGDIFFNGRPIQGLRIDERARSGITLAWQEPARYEGLLVRQYLSAAARGKPDGRVDAALEEVGLAAVQYRDRTVDHRLSGGERKKIELAAIIMMQPKLVLLDEPDSGIDVASLDKILKVMYNLKEKGTTILLITHSITVLDHAEHAFLLCAGSVIDKGPVAKIKPYFEKQCIPCEDTKGALCQGSG